jgi:hypothetical protein
MELSPSYIFLICSLYLMFIDLHICPTHSLLQSIHESLYIPNFATVLSKLLIVFCFVCHFYAHF